MGSEHKEGTVFLLVLTDRLKETQTNSQTDLSVELGGQLETFVTRVVGCVKPG